MMDRGKTGVTTTASRLNDMPVHMFAEVFPIKTDALPPLSAYKIITRSDSARKVGARLALELRDHFGGEWVWAGGRILTDQTPNPVKLVMALDDLKGHYRDVEALEEDFGWQPTADHLADFVARGPLTRLEDTLIEALAKTAFGIKNTRTQREYRIRTWTVDNQPALSITVVSRLLYEPDLQAYVTTLEKPTDMIGLYVADKWANVQGEIVKVVGTVDEQRERLLKLTERAEMRELIERAPGDHWVARVLVDTREFDYVTDALDLVIRLRDISKFEINTAQMEKALHLNPPLHAQMVKIISDVLKDHNLISNAYSTQNHAALFAGGTPKFTLAYGSGKSRPFDPARIAQDFVAAGAHELPAADKPLRVVILNTLADIRDFTEALRRALERDFKLKIDIVRERNMRVISQANLESAVRLLIKEPHDLALAFLPDELDSSEEEAVDDRNTRMQTVGRGLPTLLIHESTMNNPAAMNNVIMGMMARAGGIPYLLEESLPYADRVVGLSLIEHTKKDVPHMTGVSRVYKKDGAFMGYVIATERVPDGEPVPDALLARILPQDLVGGKRVVLHLDGKMRREVLRAIGAWEGEIDAEFFPVEVIRAGVPRMYALNGKSIAPPNWGSTFRLGETEAFVLTATGDAAIQPLYLRTEPSLPIEQAVHSVMAFTLFHYGAVKIPKLPVTLYGSEAIEAGILRGILDENQVGTTPFWL